MGGGMKEECECYLSKSPSVPRTIVLMGRTGNGKSATGNSILGKPVLKSKTNAGGVTRTTECHSTTLTNGQVVNVIDTPGLFDSCVGSEIISKEILRCVELAKDDGIDAVLLVLTVRSRFSEEEAAVIQTLQNFFGPKLTAHMIVLFTGADDFQEDDSLDDFLQTAPQSLKNIVHVCNNRVLIFDNRTKDEKKKAQQLHLLLTLVDEVVKENGGHAYTNDLFAEFREAGRLKREKEEENASDEQLKRMEQLMEAKLTEITEMLQKQLDEEKAARERAEKNAEDAKKQAEDNIEELRENLARAEMKAQEAVNKCAIL